MAAVVVLAAAAGGVALAVRSGGSGHRAAPTPILSGLDSSSPPGTTFCDLRRQQPSVESGIARIQRDGRGQWTIENIEAANMARVAPAAIQTSARTFAAAVASWPTDHGAIATSDVRAAAQALDAFTTAHCP